MDYRLTTPALKDLDDIWDFIAEDNPDAADRVIDKLYERFVTLAEYPELGKTCDELRPGLRRFPVNPHVILYRIGQDHLEIVRILHGARDIEALFENYG